MRPNDAQAPTGKGEGIRARQRDKAQGGHNRAQVGHHPDPAKLGALRGERLRHQDPLLRQKVARSSEPLSRQSTSRNLMCGWAALICWATAADSHMHFDSSNFQKRGLFSRKRATPAWPG